MHGKDLSFLDLSRQVNASPNFLKLPTSDAMKQQNNQGDLSSKSTRSGFTTSESRNGGNGNGSSSNYTNVTSVKAPVPKV